MHPCAIRTGEYTPWTQCWRALNKIWTPKALKTFGHQTGPGEECAAASFRCVRFWPYCCCCCCSGDSKLNALGKQLLPNIGHFFKGCGPIRPRCARGVWAGMQMDSIWWSQANTYAHAIPVNVHVSLPVNVQENTALGHPWAACMLRRRSQDLALRCTMPGCMHAAPCLAACVPHHAWLHACCVVPGCMHATPCLAACMPHHAWLHACHSILGCMHAASSLAPCQAEPGCMHAASCLAACLLRSSYSPQGVRSTWSCSACLQARALKQKHHKSTLTRDTKLPRRSQGRQYQLEGTMWPQAQCKQLAPCYVLYTRCMAQAQCKQLALCYVLYTRCMAQAQCKQLAPCYVLYTRCMAQAQCKQLAPCYVLYTRCMAQAPFPAAFPLSLCPHVLQALLKGCVLVQVGFVAANFLPLDLQSFVCLCHPRLPLHCPHTLIIVSVVHRLHCFCFIEQLRRSVSGMALAL